MLLSIIFWILLGSAILVVALADMLIIAYTFTLIKKMLFSKNKKETVKSTTDVNPQI